MNRPHRFLTLSAAALLLCLSATASAATFVVDRTDDLNDASITACTSAPNDCTLRGAIQIANNTSGADIITLPAGTYKITIVPSHSLPNSAGDFAVMDAVTINGAGAKRTIVDGNGIDRVMSVIGNNIPAGLGVTLANFTLTNGKSPFAGGGLSISEADVTLNRMIVKDNVAGSTLSTNGGGIDVRLKAGQTVTISRSIITGNSAGPGGNGGGISFAEQTGDGGKLRLINDTIMGNHIPDDSTGHSAEASGGGVYISGDDLSAVFNNNTITNNNAGVTGAVPGDGGGVFIETANPSQFTVSNTLIANNTVKGGNGADCTGSFTSKGHNFVTDGGACPAIVNGTNHDVVGGDPKLDPTGLKFNHVGTQSLALLAGSPAVDAGDDATCALIDARGVMRPQGSACDIGAYEKGSCGDKFLEPEEQCDDGNSTDGDGCSSTCTDEVPGAQCGNGSVEGDEECDDGNTTDGDGCSSACLSETTADPSEGTTTGDATAGGTTSGDTTGGTTTGSSGSGGSAGGGCSLIR